MCSILSSALFSAVLAAVPSTALAYEPQLMEWLLHIDRSPTREQLVAAGAGERGEQLAVAVHDTQLLRYARMRAAGALGLFDGPLARETLAGVVMDAGFDDREVRIQAIAALALLERRDRGSGLSRLATLLGDRDEGVRAAAVRAAARVGGDEARALLSARRSSEQTPWVRALIDAKLSR